MLMVVFGAGASYDSTPTLHPGGDREADEDRLPLSEDLFDDREPFLHDRQLFPQMHAILPYLLLRGERSIEDVLQELQDQAHGDLERFRQLAAVRYYLQFSIWRCEQKWRARSQGISNYKTFLDQLRHQNRSDEPICLVTFNYDTMVEDELSSQMLRFAELTDYVSGARFRLFKLHGSVNWAREVTTAVTDVAKRDEMEICYELVDRAAEIEVSNRYQIVRQLPAARLGQTALFPALALPVERKSVFECPPEHLSALKEMVTRVTHVVCVGWRATERHFLELLTQNLPGSVRGLIVCGTKENGDATADCIRQAGIAGTFETTEAGFSRMVIEKTFLSWLKSL